MFTIITSETKSEIKKNLKKHAVKILIKLICYINIRTKDILM